MSAEPADEQPNPRTIPRPPSHPSGGEQDRLGPFDELPVRDRLISGARGSQSENANKPAQFQHTESK